MHFKTPLSKLLLLVFVILSYSSFSQTEPKEEEVFTIVEQMPEYPGGQEAMYNLIANNLVYPQQAITDSVEGKVYLNFIVEKEGSISNAKVLRGIGSGCDEEALRMVSLFPKWNPGKQEGKIVRVSYNLPFVFKLQTIDKDRIYYTADTMPGFYGGTDALNEFIKTNLRYPTSIFEDKAIDSIDVLFVVEKDGSISNVTLKNKKDTLNAYDFEAMRIVKELPKFVPAYNKGKTVRIMLLQEVVFDYNKININDMETVSENYQGNEYSYYIKKTVFTVVETMPKFPGGTGAMYRYIAESVKYPIASKNKGEQGRVFVNFVVEKDGSISHVKVLRGVSPLLDAEAVRIITNMPKWTPGMQKGEAVRVNYNLPIKFTLTKSEPSKKKKRRR